MKKALFGALILIVVAVFIFFQVNKNQNTISYSLGDSVYRLLTAKTAPEWEKGLMNVRQLDNADGMIFIFPDKQTRTFWNKNTLVDLDLYWLDDERIVGKSYLPSIEKSKDIVQVSSPAPANKVVELVR